MKTHVIYDEAALTKGAVNRALESTSTLIYLFESSQDSSLFQGVSKERAVKAIYVQRLFPAFIRASLLPERQGYQSLLSEFKIEDVEAISSFLRQYYPVDSKKHILDMLSNDRKITIITRLPTYLFAEVYNLNEKSDFYFAVKNNNLVILTPYNYFPRNRLAVSYTMENEIIQYTVSQILNSRAKLTFFVNPLIDYIKSIGHSIKGISENKTTVLINDERPEDTEFIDHYVPDFDRLEDLVEVQEVDNIKDVLNFPYIKDKPNQNL
ncbi:MAG TPA: hypothetical protein VJJ23_03880 [Candidatus Nanoarchaeia archaeon]|nr:hypothetical protein [Candidatus Nanoarchaeia archaeon]